MASFAAKRLASERAKWRKEHPHGFHAKMAPQASGRGQDPFKWNCGIPGNESFYIFHLMKTIVMNVNVCAEVNQTRYTKALP